MKIVQIIPSLVRGGAERFVVDLSNELVTGFANEVILISLYDNEPTNTFVEELNASVTYHTLQKKGGLDLAVFSKLSKLIRQLKPDIVHVHLGVLEYVIPAVYAYSRAKYYFTVHNQADKECPRPKRILKRLRAALFRRKIQAVVISAGSAKSFVDFYGTSVYKLIENGRPHLYLSPAVAALKTRYQTGEYDCLLVNIARISPEKNQQLLINAVKQVNKCRQFKLKLLIIGHVQDIELFDHLKTLVHDESVEFLGGKSNVADYLAIADYFCLSSEYEGMPISLIEALSLGCIPICTAVGGVKNMIVDGKTGFLCASLETEDYVQTITRALNTQDKEQIQNNCKEIFNNRYHISITGENYMDIFK